MGGAAGPGQEPAPGAAPDPAAAESERLARLPGTWQLAGWLLMRPVSLYDRLRTFGIEPNTPGWRLWRSDAVARAYLTRMALLLVLGTSTITAVAGFLRAIVSTDVDWMRLALSVAVGVVIGAFAGVAGEMAAGVAGAAAVTTNLFWGAAVGGAVTASVTLLVVVTVQYSVFFAVITSWIIFDANARPPA